MSFTEQANQIFNRVIEDYHITDDVNSPIHNPYVRDSKSISEVLDRYCPMAL